MRDREVPSRFLPVNGRFGKESGRFEQTIRIDYRPPKGETNYEETTTHSRMSRRRSDDGTNHKTGAARAFTLRRYGGLDQRAVRVRPPVAQVVPVCAGASRIGWDSGTAFVRGLGGEVTPEVEGPDSNGVSRISLFVPIRAHKANPEWLYDRSWDLVRVTKRGVDDPQERMSIRTRQSGLSAPSM